MTGAAAPFLRPGPVLVLALKDLRHGWATAACMTIAVAAALLPLLVLFGLKFGVVTNLIETLRSDPNVREIRLVRDTELPLAWFDDFALRPDVAFLLPRANFLAASIRLRGADGRALLETRMLPTAQGDPLIRDLPVPDAMTEILMTTQAALQSNTTAGDQVELIIQRTVRQERQAERVTATVIGVVPRDRLQTDDILVTPDFENIVETWRQGFAVPELGWRADDTTLDRIRPDRQSFSSFRLYTRDVRDVPGMRDALLDRGLDVRTRAEEVVRVLIIERALSLIFVAIMVLGAVGFLLTLGLHLAASVVEKARELAILRLLGMNSLEISLMPSVQGMVIAGAGAVMASVVAVLGQPVVNVIFQGLGGIEGRISHLTISHVAVAIGATTLAGGLAGSVAGARSAAIEPSRGLRHD